MALPRRKLFRRGERFVTVKRVPLGSGHYLEAGTPVAAPEFKRWRLQSWYRRGFIGIQGDAWTEWALERYKARLEREAEGAPEAPQSRVLGRLRNLLGGES